MILPDKPGVELLSIRTLGGLAIWLDAPDVMHRAPGLSVRGASNQTIALETRTVEALLVYLACLGRPVARDILAELLWPERTQTQSRANLSLAIHRLRRQLAPYLLVSRQSVAIDPNARIDLDVAQFESYLAAGQLAAATACYAGDFLDGFALRDSPAFEQWALLERERLRTLAIAAYQQLSVQRAAAGQVDTAIASAQRLLQLDPLHEPTHRQLMRLLAQSGQRSAALAQYESCRQLLTAELEVTPDEATTALYEQIRAGELEKMSPTQDVGRWQADKTNSSAPTLVNQPSGHPVTLPSLHNLPAQPTPFIGRSAELAQIETLLATPDCRLLTLLGPGGIGKTRLAIEAATRQAGNFAAGVCFVSLAAVETTEVVAVMLAQSLGIQTAAADLQAEIAAYLRSRQLLLVLDNFEQVVMAADSVAHLLQHAPRVKVLVTSRERLYLREEWLMPIAGLSPAEGLAGEAGQLFLRSAQQVQPGFTGREQEEAIAAICRQLEGMPLALELAASWVRVMPCAEIARQIWQNFDFLTTTLRDAPERHRSMRALFDQSWRLLSPLEQGVLMRLSVFQGGWRLEEAAPVTGATLALLLSLVDKSLVRTDGQNRFDLHELMRQYAAEQLAASGETDLIRQRHYAAYLQLFRTADSHLRGPEAATWFARLQPEQDNLRAACQWTLEAARYTDTAWLVVAANWYWEEQGLQYDAGRWLVQLLPHRHKLASDLRLALWIILNASSAHIPDEFQPVNRYTAELIELLKDCSDKLLQSIVWYFLAGNYSDFLQAAAVLEWSIALARAARQAPGLGPEFCLLTDGDFVLGIELSSYSHRLCEHGEFAQAAPLAAESFSLFQAHGNRYERAGSLGVLGLLALLQGDLVEAHKLLHETVTIAAAVNYQEVLCTWQPLLGLVALYRGETIEARRLLTESLGRCVKLKEKHLLARNCTYLAETALWEGLPDEAAQWLAQSLAYHVEPQWITIHEVTLLWVAARLATAQQQYLRAAALFGFADQAHSQIHDAIAGPVRALADAALATVRAALEPAVFAEAFATGQQMSLAEAFATILAPTQFAGVATNHHSTSPQFTHNSCLTSSMSASASFAINTLGIILAQSKRNLR